MRVALWPRRSWSRSFRYALIRLKRLKAVPRKLALGAAAGVFVAVLPIPGLQLLAAAGLAWAVRGHCGVAALATFAANPVTYPLIWIASYITGATLLGTPVSDATHDLDAFADMMAHSWSTSTSSHAPAAGGWSSMLPIFGTLAIGALPLAIISALGAYFVTRHLLRQRDAPPLPDRDAGISRAIARRGSARRLVAQTHPLRRHAKKAA